MPLERLSLLRTTVKATLGQEALVKLCIASLGCHSQALLPVQAVLNGIFSSYGLDRAAELDPIAKARLSLRLLQFVTYSDSKDLVLTFDSFPEEERFNKDKNDISCLGVGLLQRFVRFVVPSNPII